HHPPSPPFPYTTLFRSERALQQGRQQRRRYALSGNIGDHHRPARVGYSRDIVIVSADLQRGHAAAACPQPSAGGKRARQEALLEDRKSTRLNSSHVAIS